jgi:hypothetical protein
MDWELIKGGAALWGALLSTWLLLVKFLETRPLITLEVIERDDWSDKSYRVRVRNASRHPIQLEKVRVLWPWNDGAIENVRLDGWEIRDVTGSAMSGRLDVFLKEDQEATIPFTLKDDVPDRLLLGIFWYRQKSFVMPTAPTLIYRTKRRLAELREHPIRVTKDELDRQKREER